VRVTDIEPGAVATELADSIKHEATKEAVIGSGGMPRMPIFFRPRILPAQFFTW